MDHVLFALWFFWPAGIAIMVPVLMTSIPLIKNWNAPMDFGKSWRGKRIFGDNKTWRGLISGTLAGTVWGVVQVWLYRNSEFVRSFNEINYGVWTVLFAVFLVSLGALIGDAVGSFLKRQNEIAPGTSWFPYDQIDFIFGGVALSLLAVRLSATTYIVIILTWLVIHLFFGWLGYIFKYKDRPL
jgi:CDP-2,3-bis-(O-geranylgeranyl)-sn-glycerol synthase